MADGITSPPAALADEDGPPREKRFTVAEFLRLGELGAFDDPYRFELWDGRVMMTPPPGGKHMGSERELNERLVLALHVAGLLGQFRVQTGGGFALNELNYRMPDLMVVRAIEREAELLPSDVLLAIEIANSSLSDDLGEKRTKYAAAEIPEYWVLDVRARRLHVFRQPRHGDYSARETLDPEAMVAPVFAPQIALRVGDLV